MTDVQLTYPIDQKMIYYSVRMIGSRFRLEFIVAFNGPIVMESQDAIHLSDC